MTWDARHKRLSDFFDDDKRRVGMKTRLQKRIVGLCTVLPLTPIEPVKKVWKDIKCEPQEFSE